MVQFDNQARQIKVKIVYYGPALGGKTTCLQQIHRATDPERRTKLYSLSTAADRTLFFDLLALDLGRIRGYQLALQVYTVPGQVQYNATRRAVLSGADGVVFVADSQPSQRESNVGALENLWENLAANGLDRETVPLVFQYNKRDLEPVLSTDELNADLNARGVETFDTVATAGDGVMEGFAAIAERTLEAVAGKLGVGSSAVALQRLRAQARAALEPFVGDQTVAEDEHEVIRPSTEVDPGEALSEEALVGEAVRANMAMTDLTARLDGAQRQLVRRARIMQAIAEFGQALSAARDTGEVLRQLLTTAVRHLRLQAAAVLVVPGSGQLRQAALHGFQEDPLLKTPDEVGEPLALGLLADASARLISIEEEDGDDEILVAAVTAAGFTSAVAVPMMAQERIVGLLTCYSGGGRDPLVKDDLQLASVLATTAAMGYANASAWRRLEDLNRGLEAQVGERTRELRASLDDVERLNGELSEVNRRLETAYRELAELDRIKNELIERVSSRMKGPVTSLQTAATVLQSSASDLPDRIARFADIIRGEADKLGEIVDSSIEASVLGSTQRQPELESVPIHDLLRQAIGPVRDLAQQREVKLQVLVPNDLKEVTCDPATMEAALRAVVKNGVEFNRKGGEVRVEVRRVAQGSTPFIELKVRDTGTGIAADDLDQVFETFWQGASSLTGAGQGVGLGLAIVKRVVEAHGGTISVSSTVGEGTEVTIHLPQRD